LFVLIALQKLIYAKFKIGGKVPPEEYVEGLGPRPMPPPGSDKKEVHIFSHQGLKSGNVVLNVMTATLARHGRLYRIPHPKL